MTPEHSEDIARASRWATSLDVGRRPDDFDVDVMTLTGNAACEIAEVLRAVAARAERAEAALARVRGLFNKVGDPSREELRAAIEEP